MSKKSNQVNQQLDLAKKVKKLIPTVQKYFPQADMVEATEILTKFTNYEHDTIKEIEEQIELYYKISKRGER